MKYEKYLVKKGKSDLLSSLKALNEDLLNEKIKKYGVSDIYELKDYIVDTFRDCLNECQYDTATIIYFKELIRNENSNILFAIKQDIESLFVFVYNGGKSYYIPNEIKQIINEYLKDFALEAGFNLTYAANTPIIKNLKGLLETLVVKDLKNIGNLLHVSGLSNKPKKEIVKIIYNALTDKDKLTNLIERFIDKEFNLLKDLIQNKGTIQDNNISVDAYNFLYVTGLIFIFRRENKFYVSMTDDVYDVVKEIDLEQLQTIIDENTKVYNLVKAMVELYGVVSYSEVVDYYSLYYGNGDKLDIPNNALFFCERNDNISPINLNYHTYFVHNIFLMHDLDDILDQIITRHLEVKRKPIKLEDLLKYSNYDYYEETDAKNKFKLYLKKKNISSSNIEIIIKAISDMYRLGNDFIMGSFKLLIDYGLKLTESNYKETLHYLEEIYNNTRIWSNNGWTPIEMRKEYK